jgi:hypothetical protein
VRLQQLARRIEPVSLRILGKIVKYLGELKCTTELCGDAPACRRLSAEDAPRPPADRHCHALAIAIELLEAGRRTSVRTSISTPSMMARKSSHRRL